MKIKFEHKRIAGVLTVIPENEYGFEDDIQEENLTRVRRLKRIMGFDKRRRVKKDTLVSDAFAYALHHLIDQQWITREEIGAIITVTITPDYFLPSMSSQIHAEFGLPEDVICMDVPQGCAGYIMGILQSCMLLMHMDKKVLLFTGDILTRKENENEKKSSAPQFGGDAFSVSVIENDPEADDIYFNIKSNGTEGKALIMQGGAFKRPVYEGDNISYVNSEGEEKSILGIDMEGSSVFNFIQRDVPPLMDELYDYAGVEKEQVEHFLFHQPNRYILEKLADRMGVPREKMPMTIVERYGNSNSSTVPMVMTEYVRDELMEKESLCCLAGFGAGLAWAGLVTRVGGFRFCEMIDSKL